MSTLKGKDYAVAMVTGVVIAVSSLVITYAARKIETKQEVKLIGR